MTTDSSATPSPELLKIFPSQCMLGEGPVYSDTYQCTFWVDIWGQRLFQLDWPDLCLHEFSMPEPLCWVVEAQGGRLIGGFKTGIYELDPHSFARKHLLDIPDSSTHNRLNDAKVDRGGHLFFGTMDIDEQAPTGSLYRLGADFTAHKVDSGYAVCNGPAVSAQGQFLYSTASSEQTIFRFALDKAGRISDKTVFVRFDPAMGYPDGMTVDSQDHLWVAAWDGAAVFRFDPNGTLVQRLALPVTRPTSVAFVGPRRDHLVITSASVGLSQQQLAHHPHSGSTLLFKMPLSGLPETQACLVTD